MAHETCCEGSFWVYILVIVGLVLFAGLMSGLTLGLMSLGRRDLEVLLKSGVDKDRKHAAKILPVVKNQHLLLCTLLVCNALAMEALPIFLDALISAWGAILISVTLILMFGEVIPQSVCSRYGLAIGATMAPVVRALVFICFPITYPISKLLDCLLGKDQVALFRRAELKTLVTMHGNEAGIGGELTHDETTIIAGALELTEKKAADAMTPLSEVFAVKINEPLSKETLARILEKGHSRIPVYIGQPKYVIGVILVKNLLTIEPSDQTFVRDVTIRKVPRISESMPLYDILNEFQKGLSHIAVVVSSKKGRREESNQNHGSSVTRRLSGMKNPPQISSKRGSAGAAAEDLPKMNLESEVSRTKSQALASRRGKKYGPEHVVKMDETFPPRFPEDEEVVGIITLEDVIEELLQEEILDETDIRIDVTKFGNGA
ncbi:hypothetical protein GOP47_0002794 [Adiantum capillus-veneris]|uniref:CNNM transmembrane domain-containing protein n=1 Tax=Adiantum capillus-veneris TaxID=13818 RepID=A0A9D4ZR93_ADICA|nr:hypothetical protein GOP47_0002794 [Adiantum capillus-veneris]